MGNDYIVLDFLYNELLRLIDEVPSIPIEKAFLVYNMYYCSNCLDKYKHLFGPKENYITYGSHALAIFCNISSCKKFLGETSFSYYGYSMLKRLFSFLGENNITLNSNTKPLFYNILRRIDIDYQSYDIKLELVKDVYKASGILFPMELIL